jgi:hypothetical protein
LELVPPVLEVFELEVFEPELLFSVLTELKLVPLVFKVFELELLFSVFEELELVPLVLEVFELELLLPPPPQAFKLNRVKKEREVLKSIFICFPYDFRL